MRHVLLTLIVLIVAGLFQSLSIEASQHSFPSTVGLPNGFQPEGIVSGQGTDFYVGSLAEGAIFKGDLRTGQGNILVPPQEGRVAVGLAFDQRTGYLFVAGGPTGAAHVYDTANGNTVQSFQLATGDTFINDAVVTREAVFFTDSFNPVLYKLSLSAGGSVPDSGAVTDIPLGGDFTMVEGFNANGIDATPNEEFLIIVNSALGTLYKVDPRTGEASGIDLGADTVPSGDGILLDGKTLYVVQNFLNQIAVVELDNQRESGTVVRHITDSAFRIPTTVTELGNSLYVVNARFDVSPTPDTEYEVVRVLKQ